MPITIAHPAAALPFWWILPRRLPLSALCIGSLSPDFEYYFHMMPHGRFGHSLTGLFAFDLPISLAVLFIFHRLVKQPLLLLIPQRASHLGHTLNKPFNFIPLSRFFFICIAILLGAFSHLAWDSVTHQYGWLVMQFPALHSPISLTGRFSISTYSFLQLSGGVLGLMILAIAAFLWAIRQPRNHTMQVLPAKWRYFAITTLIAAGILSTIFNILRVTNGHFTTHMLHIMAVAAVIGCLTGLAIAITLYACILRLLINSLARLEFPA